MMMKNEMILKPEYWASVSGGKDSLYMLKLILENPTEYRLDGVVHFELEIDFPFIHTVIDYMEKECQKHSIPFIRVKPDVSWYDLYNKMGMPTRKARWCNQHYKLRAKAIMQQMLKAKGSRLISYIGLCADETTRFKNDKTIIYPLAEKGIIEADILEWAKTQPIFNDYYKYNKRCGCMFCPMIRNDNLLYMFEYYPKEYEQFMKMCHDTEVMREKELGRPFSVFQSNPKYNVEYRDKRIRELYERRKKE